MFSVVLRENSDSKDIGRQRKQNMQVYKSTARRAQVLYITELERVMKVSSSTEKSIPLKRCVISVHNAC